jgi:hypothetical protein
MTRANAKGADGLDAGSEREVHHWLRLFADDVAGVADDTYDFGGAMLSFDVDVFADGGPHREDLSQTGELVNR